MSVTAAAQGGAAAARAGQPAWRRELLLAVGWGTAIFLVTMVPYVIGYLTTPPGKVFNGFFYLGDDGSTYIAEMRAGANGAWGWSDPYVSKPVGAPVLLYMFYILSGKLAGLLHLPLFVAFHLARLTGAVALVFAARRAAVAVLPLGRTRSIGLLLVLTGAGAGYLLALTGLALGRESILGQPLLMADLHIPEISGMFSILTFPHFAWAAAMMGLGVVGVMGVAAAPVGRDAVGPMIWATLCMVVLVLIHPQMLVVLALLAVMVAAAYRPPARRWGALAVPFVVCLPLFAYYLYILALDPVVSAFARQWTQGAYAVLPTLFAFGVPLVLATVGILAGSIRQHPARLVMAAWLVVVLVLLYAPSPVSIQRRLFDGIFFPIGLLAAIGIEALSRRGRGFLSARRLSTYMVAACIVTSVLMLVVPVLIATSRVPDIYLDSSEAQAMDWMATGVGSGTPSAVLCVAGTGLFIPARAGDRVYTGNDSQTIDSDARRIAGAEAIRSGGIQLLAFMRAQETSYLFIGPRERASGVGPIGAGLNLVYDRDGVQIYRLEG
jgi:hypothetical protein